MESSQRVMSAPFAAPAGLNSPNRSCALPNAALFASGSPSSALSLRGMTLELWLILIYIVAATVGDLKVAKLSVQVGGVPVFFTDITLVVLLVTSFIRWPARFLYWASEGTGAGLVGRGVWLLCLLAMVYFACAVPEYHLYAMRDLAIFGYSLFFPLTYFALRGREDATRLLRYFVYSGVVLALLVLVQFALSGRRGHAGLGSIAAATRYSARPSAGGHSGLGGMVLLLTNDDDAAFAMFALAALSAYIMLDRKRRALHILCATACFFALATSASRAGVVGLVLASGLTFICMGRRYRGRYSLFAATCVMAVVMAPVLPGAMPGSELLRGLRISVMSALGGPSVDSDSEFRIIRWRYATDLWLERPILGVGFGREIVPAGLVDANEGRGDYNVGMPHNTFLFLAARTGIVGLGLVLFCWLDVFKGLLGSFRRIRGPDELAVMNILIAMFGFAMFVLFFERPVTNAAFWIAMAVGARLTAYEGASSVR